MPQPNTVPLESVRVSQSLINRTASGNQYDLSPIAAHTHNGTDSLLVSYLDLSNKVIILPHTLFGTSAATSGNYSVFFVAPYAMVVLAIQEVHVTAGTAGGSVTLNVEKLTDTSAPGAGTNLLQTAFNLKGTANTLQTGTLVQPVSSKNLAAGNRLSLVLSGTPTSVANLTISVLVRF